MFCLDLALILSVTLGLCVLVGAVAGGYIACKKHKKVTRSVLGSFVFDLCFFLRHRSLESMSNDVYSSDRV